MARQQAKYATLGARGVALVAVIAALGLAACSQAAGSAAQAGHEAAAVPPGQPAPAPVPTYYLDQTYTAVGQEVSPKSHYLAMLKLCQNAKLPTTPLSTAEVEKLATERVRTWQQPGHRVVQRDTWQLAPSHVCVFDVQEESIREVRVLPQTLYVMDLTKGTVRVQTQVGPPTSMSPPITVARMESVEKTLAAQGIMKKVGNSHALGQPCSVWDGYYPDGSLWFTECAWTGGLANGVSPFSALLWRKPVKLGILGKRAITATTFLVGHLPPGSDAVFKVPAKAGPVATAGVKP